MEKQMNKTPNILYKTIAILAILCVAAIATDFGTPQPYPQMWSMRDKPLSKIVNSKKKFMQLSMSSIHCTYSKKKQTFWYAFSGFVNMTGKFDLKTGMMIPSTLEYTILEATVSDAMDLCTTADKVSGEPYISKECYDRHIAEAHRFASKDLDEWISDTPVYKQCELEGPERGPLEMR
ncbi:hypothetical protein R83H12_02028 [Fibrobacteria bacterium R8-3-H12]